MMRKAYEAQTSELSMELQVDDMFGFSSHLSVTYVLICFSSPPRFSSPQNEVLPAKLLPMNGLPASFAALQQVPG